MGSELVSPASPLSYTEQFEEVFPYYLSIGMTYEQFWEGEADLPIYYRKAHRLRLKHLNEESWLLGRYVYDAFCAASPLLHAFAKNGTKANPYLTEPYPSDADELEKRRQNRMREAAENFRALVQAKNARLRKQEVNNDVNDDRPITD